MKAAGHELKGLLSYYNCHVPGLNFPLMGLIDFRGFRVVAISYMPIGENQSELIYGR
mgnify:CR=1 FL=1